MPVKVKKPHDNWIKRLIDEDVIDLKGPQNRGTALYFCRNKPLQDLIGIKPRRQDHFTIYKKKPYRVSCEWQKQTWFTVL